MKMLKTIALTGLTLATLVFSSASMADHSWGTYHWERSSNPLNLPLGDNVDETWDGYLLTAFADWNVSSVLNTTVVPGSTNPRPCKTTSGTVQVCNRTYGNNGWLGLASISISGDHITAGYVKMNDTYFNTANYDTPAWRYLVMCQEVGHTFGLTHQDETFDNPNLGTCMDYTNDPDGTIASPDQLPNEHPNQHDYDQLGDVYFHLDSDGGDGSDGGGGGGGCNPRAPWCDPASASDALSNIEMNGPAQWGRLVSEHGLQEVYELEFGGGRKVITFVTWTLERADRHEH